ncbi:MAG: Ppx/GppA phosphatase family protein [Minwuia sp.]|uniref:Ppx/GppA phosphatase family protein n=1 Tax=Minwuia sp. TaxID=2493630 RepID=UPI003A86BE1C
MADDRFRRRSYAAIDLGTNNCRLLVARPEGKGFRVVDAYSRIVRLGEGVAETGRLAEPAMTRTVEALAVCADKIARNHCWDVRCVATAACRSAENAPEFVERVKRATGLRLEIIDAAEEAALALAGCRSLMQGQAETTLVFDIGGGSTEIALAESMPMGEHRLSTYQSFPVGVVNFAERFGGVHVDDQAYSAMVRSAEEMMRPFRTAQEQLLQSGYRLLGTSGTVTTLAGVYLELVRYDRQAVDGLTMPADRMTEISDHLRQLSLSERAAHPCVGAGRADLVVGGCAILQAILNLWPAEEITVADRGLREGILLQLMQNDAQPAAAIRA